MKVYEVAKGSGVTQLYKCGHCDGKIKPGEWVLDWLKLDRESLFTKQRVVTHIECVRKLIAEAGVPEESERAFRRLREKMVVTGKVFPS